MQSPKSSTKTSSPPPIPVTKKTQLSIIVMAKLTVLAAIFTVLVMIANTCAYSITNIEVDGYRDADMRALVRSTCCEQVQRQDLNQCVQYLKRASEGYQSLRRGCDEKEEQQQQQQAALLCCEQLRQLDDKCQCEGVVEVFKEQIQQGQLQGPGMREILQRVRELPEMCGLETQHCEIPSGCGFAF